jgi:RNA polymerase sigma-54 factor
MKQLELSQALKQRLTVTPQLILANTLLRLPSVELEQAIRRELDDNPALELVEVQRCPRCQRRLSDCRCAPANRAVPYSPGYGKGYDGGYSADRSLPTGHVIDGEEIAATSLVSSGPTIAEHLLEQARLHLPAEDLLITTHLTDHLNERGFLCCDLDEMALDLGVDRSRVEHVLSILQTLDPVGIAARDPRESMLIQLKYLRGQGIEHPLAHQLVSEHWETLAKQSFAETAREAGTTEGGVREALQFIKGNLNPFPAQAYWDGLHHSPQEQPLPIRPDIIITRRDSSPEGGYEIEIPEQQAYPLRISATYADGLGRLGASAADRERWESFFHQARLFIRSIEQRWETLRRIARHLVEVQGPFLDHGEKRLRPLTRAQLADSIGVHESTVSRAVADKYAQLPNRRIVPLARFFDSSAPIKEIIKDLIATESKPLSDREIAERLALLGHPISRRTVAKYRNALRILPSPLRRRSRLSGME